MKAHVHFEKMLAVYPSLDKVQRDIVDEHVVLCPACAKVRSAYQAMDEQVAGLDDSVPATLATKWSALARAERQPVGITPWTAPLRVGRVGLPVVLLLLLICGLWLLLRFSTPRPPEIAGTPSVTPSATSAVIASRRPDALALRVREPRPVGAERLSSSTSSGMTGRATAPTTKTPVAPEIVAEGAVSSYRRDAALVWPVMPVMLELPLAWN
jgi:hypothetical protein